MPETIETTVTFLEMLENPHLAVPHPPPLGGLALMRSDHIPVPYYRFLFDLVGRDYKWISRKLMTDEELATILHDEKTELFVLYRDGAPAGYFELNARTPGEVEISFIGVTRDNLGIGLGQYLLKSAIHRAWELRPKRVHLQTCTLDHPRALRVYQKAGFMPCGQKQEVLTFPDGY